MNVHVLAGDALAEDFQKTLIAGETVVCRECFIEGHLKADDLNDFWQKRAAFISTSHDESPADYFSKVVREFEKLEHHNNAETEINLWFENELFCQVNLWFCLNLLQGGDAKIYLVSPLRDKIDIWKGFGGSPAEDLEKCYAERIKLTKDEITLGADLWSAYQNADHEALKKLSAEKSRCFFFLDDVCQAEIEKKSRPKQVLREIIAEGKTEFGEIFREFSKRAAIYGFGDAQLKKYLTEI